jgi:glycosyltransferase involved in cell wall biosynthesis
MTVTACEIGIAGAVEPRPGKSLVLSINTAWNVYNFRRGLIAALREAGYEVVVVSPVDGFVEKLLALGCRHRPVPMAGDASSALDDLRLLFAYWRLFRAERPAVYLGYTIKPNVYGTMAARLCGVPVVNNVSGLGTAFIRETWLTRVVTVLYRLAFRGSHTVFFQNGDDRRHFVERRIVGLAKTRVLPGSGIDLAHYLPPGLPSGKRMGPRHEPLAFVLVARLLWDKGVGEFVEAARIVRRHRPDLRFQLLGFLDVENRTAVDRASVERWVAEGVVEYLGATQDVRPFIAAADCVVLPSYREGTPRSLLEGAAMGRPLIATDVPGCREVVEHGRNGLLCRVRDAADLAEKMLAFVDLPPEQRARMGREGRAKVERQFDEHLVIDRYLEVIAEILAPATAPSPQELPPPDRVATPGGTPS